MDCEASRLHPLQPLVLVNDRSGGQAGVAVRRELVRLIGAERVLGCAEHRPREVARRALDQGLLPVAAGGDGTVVGLIEAVRAEALARGRPMVPVGVLPLGTGNDLATTLGWPAGTGHRGRIEWSLKELERPSWAWIDRFTLTGPGFERAWYNYCSWGCDARVAHHFHAARRDQSWLFRSRQLNRAIYGVLGLIDHGSALPVRLEAGLRLPAWSRALVLSNVPFYAGGGRLSAAIRADDGLCDAFALGSGLLMGLGIGGLRRPYRLGRAARFTLELGRGLPLQLDGEPLVARPGRWSVRYAGRVPLAVYPGHVLRPGVGPLVAA